MDLILDTNFLVHLEREKTKGVEGAAHEFIQNHPQASFHITFTIAAEIGCGNSLRVRSDWERFVQPYHILGYSDEVGWRYGELFRFLSGKGHMIGTNDLWIAATTIANGMTLVTRNQKEFSKVPGLLLLAY